MAEEAAQELGLFEGDEEASSDAMAPPSITEVALEHATRADVVIDLTSGNGWRPAEADVGVSEEIVIDVREAGLTAPSDTSIDLTVVRDVPVAIDIESLVSLRTDTVYAEPAQRFDELVAQPAAPAEEVGVTGTDESLTRLRPIGGLAVATRGQRASKRALDILVAFVALVVLAPIMLIVAAIVKLTSRGPVLYRSSRVGQNGEEFTFLKFRSMYDGAVFDRGGLDALNEQAGPVFKMKDDPRITPFGRFIRKGSIDELPQLLHVLSGRMSLVGPRPALPQEVAEYDDRARQRLLVQPGITCIWQVSGRSTIDFDTWVDMDLEYIRSWSISRDLSLLARTVPAVVSGEGAY